MRANKNIYGIIFRIFDSKDSDKVIQIINQKGSRESTLAKGVKKTNSRKAYALDLGNLVRAKVLEGYNVEIINEVELVNEHINWKKNYKDLIYLQYICECIDKFCLENNEDHKLFNLFKNILEVNNPEKTNNFVEKLLIYFNLNLLKITGNLPNLKTDVITDQPLNAESIFSIENSVGFTSTIAEVGTSKVDLALFKITQFATNTNVDEFLKISMQSNQILKLLVLTVNWIELTIDRELKSKEFVLNNLKW